ncbi:MAG: hypothetical protein R2795_11700 [Saprospiraceae bacterium]
MRYNTAYEVINLAKGGYTSYHIMPDDFPVPPRYGVLPDTLRNITHGMAYHPDCVIVNMPSNDASYV